MSSPTTGAVTAATEAARVANPNAPLTGAAANVSEGGLIAVVWICFAVATLFVSLRVTVRFRQNRSLMLDDYWIVFAWLCILTMAILQMEQMDSLWYVTYLRAGRLVPDANTPKKSEQITRWQFPIIKLFWTTLWAIKGSFMTVFFRLVKPFPILRRLWYGVAVFTIIAYIGCWLTSVLACSPPSNYFKAGMCIGEHEKWLQKFSVYYSTSVDVASDIMIMALPISLLPSLQLDRRRKIGLGVVFSLGAIIMIVALVRMTQVETGSSNGVDIIGLAIWGSVESATAVIVGTLPALKSLLSRHVKKYSSSRNKSNYARYGTGTMGAAAVVTSRHDGYVPSSTVAQAHGSSIPLDDLHEQRDGGIYVQRSYQTTVEFDEVSSKDGDEEQIIKKVREV
ncbi:hypothetical protein N0V88_001479 [Collariella sp. IMI 366227]|nr:hypothetical protein N0V88_001479 [Collariella sp. IMI 366227]